MPTTSAHAQATRTWVSGVGDDVNPCSRTAPCKTFAGAISKTAAGGEIDCLDPGGFGAVTITKSMTIDCTGVTGGILAALSNGVIVNAGVNDKVVLRNLVIQGTAGTSIGINGVRWLAGRELHFDRVVVQGFSTRCVDVSKTAVGVLFVTDSY
ncbi:MAG: right-handed parallel beta-helix repeat-containing protein, partial [Bradyrhizobium sp.]|nr:right-handed parallel beta-helix repeat-containing protein [Bradyrhizobium sp.]